MGVQTRARGGQSLVRRAGWMLGVSALALTIALGGCRASARNGGNNGNNGVPVTQSTSGTGSSSATSATSSGSSGSGSNAALQQLESVDSQNQTDQQQINAAGGDAGVDYASQSNSIQP